MKLLALFILLLSFALTTAAQDTAPADRFADKNGQFIEVEGVQIYVRTSGAPENPAVIFIHGFMLNSAHWQETMNLAVEAGFYAVAYDRPPFGLSDRDLDVSYTDEAETAYLAGVMDALDLKKAVLVGHSEGASVAMLFALAYPQRVRGLMLVSASLGTESVERESPDVKTVAQYAALAPLFLSASNVDPASPFTVRFVANIVTPELITDIYHELGLPEDIPVPLYEGLMRNLLVDGWESALVSKVKSGIRGEDFDLKQLNTFESPVYVLWGADDPLVNVAVGREISAALPDANLEIWEGVGHFPMQEDSARFNDLFLTFLENAGGVCND